MVIPDRIVKDKLVVPFQALVTILSSTCNEPTDFASCLQHEGYGRRSGLERRVGENVLPK